MMRNISWCLLIGIVVSVIGGCNADNTIPSPTKIRFFNVTPGSDVDVYSNGKILKVGLAFDSSTGYAMGVPNLYNILVKKAHSDSVYIIGNQYLQTGIAYSMFFIPDTTSTNNAVTYATLNDNTSIANRDTVKVRFLDFSPTAPLVRLTMTRYNSAGILLDTLHNAYFNNRIFNDQASSSTYAGYQLFPAGYKIVHFLNARLSGNQSIIDSIPFNFVSQKSYTIYLKGYLGETGDRKLSATIKAD